MRTRRSIERGSITGERLGSKRKDGYMTSAVSNSSTVSIAVSCVGENDCRSCVHLSTNSSHTTAPSQAAADEFWEKHEFYWNQLDEHERRRLLRPNKSMFRCYCCGAMPAGDPGGNDQHRPDCPQFADGTSCRCYFCKRISRHSRDCWELRRRRDIKMPFGKYKGCLLGRLPPPYLVWLYRNTTLDNELRSAIRSVLEETLVDE
jgi:uncharacterized protein (DUF3820 family)